MKTMKLHRFAAVTLLLCMILSFTTQVSAEWYGTAVATYTDATASVWNDSDDIGDLLARARVDFDSSVADEGIKSSAYAYNSGATWDTMATAWEGNTELAWDWKRW